MCSHMVSTWKWSRKNLHFFWFANDVSSPQYPRDGRFNSVMVEPTRKARNVEMKTCQCWCIQNNCDNGCFHSENEGRIERKKELMRGEYKGGAICHKSFGTLEILTISPFCIIFCLIPHKWWLLITNEWVQGELQSIQNISSIHLFKLESRFQ